MKELHIRLKKLITENLMNCCTKAKVLVEMKLKKSLCEFHFYYAIPVFFFISKKDFSKAKEKHH
jgi:hypothetical protein